MSHAFHRFWLKITAAVVVGSFGPVFFLGTMATTSEPARWTLDLLDWPLDGATTYTSPDMQFLSALTGGFLFGWGGVIILCLSARVYDHAPEQIRRCVVNAPLAWFVLGTVGSIASGAPSNAIFNVFVLLLAVGPLWRPSETQQPSPKRP